MRVVLCLAALLCFYRFWVRDLTYFDESRYVEVAREMSDASSWSLPLLYDEPYTEKPPLYFWTVGLLGRVFGFGSFAAFLPNVLAHFLTVLLVFDLGRRTLSARAGAMAALALAACPLSLHFARSAQLDALLVLSETLAAYGFLLALETGAFRFGMLGALGIALGSLVKGHIVLVALLAPLCFAFLRRDFSFLRRPLRLLSGAILALLPFLLWFGWVVRDLGWEQALDLYFRRQVIDHTAGRVNHYSPIPIGTPYLASLALMLPFIAFLPGAIRASKDRLWPRTYLWWGLLFFSLFALVPAKREIYLLPLAVPLSLLAGDYLASVDLGKRPLFRGARAIGLFFSALFAVAAAGLPIFAGWQDAFSVDALLAAVGGLILGGFAFRAFQRQSSTAPLLLLFEVAVVSLFAEPAVGAYSTARFGTRSFGELIQRQVPPGEPVVVLGFTKAHAVRFFGQRRLKFVEEVWELEPCLEADRTLFVVTKQKDGERLERSRTLRSDLLLREERQSENKALRLYSVRSP